MRAVNRSRGGGRRLHGRTRSLFCVGYRLRSSGIALELVGTPTLEDSLLATRFHGTVCFSAPASNEWVVPEPYPVGDIRSVARLRAYGREAMDLPADVLQRFRPHGSRFSPTIYRVYEGLEQVAKVRRVMNANEAVGKLAVRVAHGENAYAFR